MTGIHTQLPPDAATGRAHSNVRVAARFERLCGCRLRKTVRGLD